MKLDKEAAAYDREDIERLRILLEESVLISEYQVEKLVEVIKEYNQNNEDKLDLKRFEKALKNITKAKDLISEE